MARENYGFTGFVPPGVSVEENVCIALEYQRTHSANETLLWFYNTVKNNSDGHLPQNQSWDYKQIERQYADFGNYNYGVVAKAIGCPDWFTEYMAGWAQSRSDGYDFAESILRVLILPNYSDNTDDQIMIQQGIDAANMAGISNSDLGISNYLYREISNILNTKDIEFPYGVFSSNNLLNYFDVIADSSNLPPYIPGPYSGDIIDTPIGAFYVAGDLAYDDSESNAAMTGTVVLNDSNQPAHLFAGLHTLDSNGDGLLDANDQKYSSLTVWNDLNENGLVDTGEMKPLTEVGIPPISLTIPGALLTTGLLYNPISQISQ